jgi:Hexokinase
MEKVEKIKKLPSNIHYPFAQMIIDTEWGGFGDRGEAEYIKTQYDRIVDARSVHPGVQWFDKLVAGMHMGELVRLVAEKLVKAGLLFHGEASDQFFTSNTFPTVSGEGGGFQPSSCPFLVVVDADSAVAIVVFVVVDVDGHCCLQKFISEILSDER